MAGTSRLNSACLLRFEHFEHCEPYEPAIVQMKTLCGTLAFEEKLCKF